MTLSCGLCLKYRKQNDDRDLAFVDLELWPLPGMRRKERAADADRVWELLYIERFEGSLREWKEAWWLGHEAAEIEEARL